MDDYICFCLMRRFMKERDISQLANYIFNDCVSVILERQNIP